MDWFFLLLFLFISVVVGATIGFGDSLIFIPLAGFIVGMRTAIVLAMFWSVFLLGLNAWKYRKEIDWDFLQKNLIAGTPGVILGALLISRISLRWIELVLGIFIIIFTIKKIVEWRKNDRMLSDSEDSIKKHSITLGPVDNKAVSLPLHIGGGFAFGFFGGLIGASGPVNVMLLKSTRHQRENFIATFAIGALFLDIIKNGIYLAQGLFPLEYWWIFLLGIPVIFLGASLGYLITPKIPVLKFELLILSIMFVIGVRSIASTTIFWNP